VRENKVPPISQIKRKFKRKLNENIKLNENKLKENLNKIKRKSKRKIF